MRNAVVPRFAKGQFSDGKRLFLMITPLLAIVFLFSYLPLYGWAYAFFEYRAGLKLSDVPFVGFKYFKAIVGNKILARDIVRVLRNTFAMSFLGILTSPLPIVFAILIKELRVRWYGKVIQTLSTLPNFISWIIVYSVVYSMFSVDDGFLNRLLLKLGTIQTPINYLAATDNVWLTMLGYGVWKGLGWSAIMYLAAIAAIDQELYQAAVVDGAGRFRVMWHITVPGILPTYTVLLLLSIANFINCGFEQYYVFQNPMNQQFIEVLDLYVYNTGMTGNNIPFATAVGILKSFVSVVLLFTANGLSKALRGESIL